MLGRMVEILAFRMSKCVSGVPLSREPPDALSRENLLSSAGVGEWHLPSCMSHGKGPTGDLTASTPHCIAQM